MEFDIGTLSLIVIFGLLALISIGVPLGFASGFMGAVVVFLNIGEHALGILLSRYYSLVVTYSFLSVPLFIFMASLLERSNIARDLYDALNAWLRKTRGGVGVVTAIMATIMAAMSGIIGGEIVLLGLIALPQMLRLKYDLCIWFFGHNDTSFYCFNYLWINNRDFNYNVVSRSNSSRFDDFRINNFLYSCSNKIAATSCTNK